MKSHTLDKNSNAHLKKILLHCEKLDPDIFRNSNTIQNATCCALHGVRHSVLKKKLLITSEQLEILDTNGSFKM